MSSFQIPGEGDETTKNIGYQLKKPIVVYPEKYS